MKPFFVYILRCADDSLYVGHTDDLEQRFAQHLTGVFDGHTARRSPLTLAYVSEQSTRLAALERERQLKGWSRAKKEALISRDWPRLRELAKETARRSSL